MTHYDQIMSLSVEEFAEVLTVIIHESEKNMIEKITQQSGLEIDHIAIPAVSKKNHLEWLESEVEE